MKNLQSAAVILLALAFITVLVYQLQQRNECESTGGVYVRALIGHECIHSPDKARGEP